MAGLIARLRSDPEALAAASEAARGHSRPAAGLPVEEVQRHVVVLLDAVSASLLQTEDQATTLAAADDLAVDRAHQGVPLAVVLEGFQAARGFFLRMLLQAQGEGLRAEDLLQLLVPLDERVAELQTRMINSYREAERTLARSGRAARVEALRELLSGGPVSWAEEAQLVLSRRYYCLVADVTNPRESRRVATLLETPDGVTGIVHGYLCRVTPQPPPSHRLEDVLVVGAGPVVPGELADAYRLCREALVAGRARGRRGMHAVTDLALGIAVDAQPLLGRMLASTHLGALDGEDAFHRLLAETGRVFLQHGSRVEPTAAALHVHPNTVKYRVRRLSELVAFDVATPPGEALDRSLRWWWALDAWLAGKGDP